MTKLKVLSEKSLSDYHIHQGSLMSWPSSENVSEGIFHNLNLSKIFNLGGKYPLPTSESNSNYVISYSKVPQNIIFAFSNINMLVNDKAP